MDKKIAGLLGAVAALGTLNAVQATPAPAPTDVLKANSYAELLEPIPNALKVLQALDEQSPVTSTGAAVKVAQWHHHHHHHHPTVIGIITITTAISARASMSCRRAATITIIITITTTIITVIGIGNDPLRGGIGNAAWRSILNGSGASSFWIAVLDQPDF